MKGERLKHTLALWTMRSSAKRTEYLKKHNVFAAMGEHCIFMKRSIPLYAKLIHMGDNVRVASNVGFVTHDGTHNMLNYSEAAMKLTGGKKLQEKIGCIEIGDNVFIGSGTRILYDVRIGSNVIIGSGSVVNRDIPDNSIAAGTPARVIGTIDDYIKKRMKETQYPENLKPRKEYVSPELAEFLWNEFRESRRKSSVGETEAER